MTTQFQNKESYQPQINDTFKEYNEFVNKIKDYAHELGFIVRLGKVEYSNKTEKKIRKEHCCALASQRCGCSFYVRASLNSENGSWYIISMNLIHNHQMVDENHRMFISNERHIPERGRPSSKRIPNSQSTTSSIIHVNPLREIQNFNTTTTYSQGSSSSDQYFVETDFLSDESNLQMLKVEISSYEHNSNTTTVHSQGSSSSSQYFIEPGFLSDESNL
ncbi:21551_t:CDS:2, partial [Gigaspora rosea]